MKITSPSIVVIKPLLIILLLQTGAPAESFKVMTYNILASFLEPTSGIDQTHIGWFGPEQPRKERVHAILDQEDADLIGFQEVTNDQLPDLVEFLPGYEHISVTRTGIYNAIFYRRDRYLLQANGTFDLPEGSRHVIWARMYDWHTGQAFVIGNTHLACCGQSLQRQLQANAIQEEMPPITNGLPLVFVGDLNSNPYGGAYSIITGQTGPQNFTLEDACGPFCGDVPTYPFGSRIDHVLHSADIVAADARVVTDLVDGLLPSDHFPVTAELINSAPSTGPPDSVTRGLSPPEGPDDQIVWESDIDGGFDGIGDGKGSIFTSGFVGANGNFFTNVLTRRVMKFHVPEIPLVDTVVEHAMLRIFVEDVDGTLPEGLSLMHGTFDNHPEVRISDYEAEYTDTELDLIVPQDGTGQYYEIDVTEFVKTDIRSDGPDVWSAFRLELTDGEQFTGGRVGYKTDDAQLVVTFDIVPEPESVGLFMIGMLFFGANVHCRRWSNRPT